MNYISAAVYVLLALSMAIGIKIASRSQFNKDSLSMDAMTCLKGVMALFVVLHHLSQKNFSRKQARFLFLNILAFFLSEFSFSLRVTDFTKVS